MPAPQFRLAFGMWTRREAIDPEQPVVCRLGVESVRRLRIQPNLEVRASNTDGGAELFIHGPTSIGQASSIYAALAATGSA
jgi:hypothetical protein